jgi:hypothetical protein
MLDVAKVLKSRMGAAAKRVPLRQLPNWLVRIAALRDLPELGKKKNATNEKARRMLAWAPRSNEESIRGHRRKPGAPRASEKAGRLILSKSIQEPACARI